ncbi:MAG: glycosyltransferase [bacterium]|nr:glycosyltransferase [bacterium]
MRKKNGLLFSIILPVYKQESHIVPLLQEFIKGLQKITKQYELLVIINGPASNEYKRLVEFAKPRDFIRAFYLDRAGWGRAVKFGISKAKGRYICYTNSARTNVADLLQMLSYSKNNKDVVVKATRIIRESWMRKFGSILYNLENRFLLKTPVWDVNGTPKVFPKNLLKKITLDSENDLIDAELMVKCFRNHIPILEVPVLFTKRKGGKSTTNLLSAFRMYLGLLELKKRL